MINEILRDVWLEVIHKNLKWSATIIIRAICLIFIISVCLGLCKLTGLIKTDANVKSQITISNENTVNLTKPGRDDYVPDIKDIDATIVLLKKAKENMKKEATNVKAPK